MPLSLIGRSEWPFFKAMPFRICRDWTSRKRCLPRMGTPFPRHVLRVIFELNLFLISVIQMPPPWFQYGLLVGHIDVSLVSTSPAVCVESSSILRVPAATLNVPRVYTPFPLHGWQLGSTPQPLVIRPSITHILELQFSYLIGRFARTCSLRSYQFDKHRVQVRFLILEWSLLTLIITRG